MESTPGEMELKDNEAGGAEEDGFKKVDDDQKDEELDILKIRF
jgi:hypothetical protein